MTMDTERVLAKLAELQAGASLPHRASGSQIVDSQGIYCGEFYGYSDDGVTNKLNAELHALSCFLLRAVEGWAGAFDNCGCSPREHEERCPVLPRQIFFADLAQALGEGDEKT